MLSLPKLALVSGGTRGLGLAIVEGFVRNGFRVVTFSRKPSNELAALQERSPGSITFFPGDLGDRPSLVRIVDDVEKTIGPIGVLVNNAAVVKENLLTMLNERDIDMVIDVNLRGTLALIKRVVRGMMIRRAGRIITISSIVSVRGYSGTAPYAASKGGLDAMTRALAREVGGRNITVNSIAPGYMKTELTREMNQKQLAQIVRRTPLGRPGTVDDIVPTVLFFASEQARFVTGQTLVIDGGLTC